MSEYGGRGQETGVSVLCGLTGIQSFLARADAGGSTEDNELHIEVNENDEITGFSLSMNPDSQTPQDTAAHVVSADDF